ncbi:SgrR family transcriptional regulator [Bacillus sp. Xin]|uniref:ABC transporter substrate-binding protein n=1 Tax=unclassified Bacillus (in: firmicutes) TaxID=185979 RepID=UPI0015724004|nr:MULTISPECIES: SgrR family transcriptional regulator [unclassified Bacillus (in: firmicutes)]MBC6973082.1 SgrR family transcriptional regulator [Bacillus sp. Xin]NSW36272.1 SgrR family transcriptional regulator [Bacillus sp. Xin1]
MKKGRMKEWDFSPFRGMNMVILDQYVQLWIRYGKGIPEGEKIEITLQNISETLFCTDRNSKFIIKKLEELGWVCWSPGRGRGNRSKVSFQKDPTSLILEKGKEITKQGDVKGGKEFVEQYMEYFPMLQKQFQTWINSIFGYQIEMTNQGRQDVLRLQVEMRPKILLDPMYATMRSECHMVKHVYDTLVYVNESTNVIEPRLAFHWEYNDDQKMWTFYLRKGVQFHNGKRFTAHDVAYSFNRFMNTEDNPYLWMLQHVERIHIVNEHIVEVYLYTENKLLLHILGAEQCSIVTEDEEGNVSGTGPFKLRENNDSIFVLEVHNSYFRERPFLDRIELWNVPKSTDEYDVSMKAEHKEIENPHKELSKMESNVTYVTLNTKKQGPLQNSTFRQALYRIIHSNKIIDELEGERGEGADELLLGNRATWSINEDVNTLLQKSEYSGEVLYLYTFKEQDHVEDSKWIQKKCAKYGITIEIHFLDALELLRVETMEQADLIHDSATISEQIELSFLQMFLAKNSFINQHSSLDFHEQLHAYFIEPNLENRMTLLRDVEDTLLRNIHIIPLYRNKQHISTHEKVQNIRINSQGWIDFYNIWFKP